MITWRNTNSPKMQTLSKSKTAKTCLDKALDISCVILLAALWITTFYVIPKMPEIIPIHFGWEGKADGFGKRDTLIVFPIIATFIVGVFSLFSMFPDLMMIGKEKFIAAEKRDRFKSFSIRFIRIMRIALLLMFFVILYSIHNAAHSAKFELGSWDIPLALGLIFVPIILFLYSLWKQGVYTS